MNCKSEGATHHYACECREKYIQMLETAARDIVRVIKQLERMGIHARALHDHIATLDFVLHNKQPKEKQKCP